MALIKCPECGGTVSSFAKVCPHCGRSLDRVEEAPKQASSGPAYEPISSPVSKPVLQYPSFNLSMETIGKVLMIFLAFIAIIFQIITRAHIYDVFEYRDTISQGFRDGAHGILFSVVTLYFLIQTFRPGSLLKQRFLGFFLAMMAMFMNVVPLLHLEIADLDVAYQSVALVFGLFLMFYASTKQDWSKYVMLVTGVMCIVRASFRSWGGRYISDYVPQEIRIALLALCAIYAILMLIFWLKEAATVENHPMFKLLSLIVAMMIITAIIVVAVMIRDIFSTDPEIWAQRYNSVKLSLIFGLIAGLSSLLFSLMFVKDKFLFVISAWFVSILTYVLLGLDYEISSITGRQMFQYIVNIHYTFTFMLPICIIMVYVAEWTKGIGSKISIRI